MAAPKQRGLLQPGPKARRAAPPPPLSAEGRLAEPTLCATAGRPPALPGTAVLDGGLCTPTRADGPARSGHGGQAYAPNPLCLWPGSWALLPWPHGPCRGVGAGLPALFPFCGRPARPNRVGWATCSAKDQTAWRPPLGPATRRPGASSFLFRRAPRPGNLRRHKWLFPSNPGRPAVPKRDAKAALLEICGLAG